MKTTSPELVQLVRLIREARLQDAKTQQELADELGVHKNTVANLERGRQDPLPWLHAIEEATGKPQGWFMDHVDPYTRVLKLADDISQMKSDIRDILGLLRQDGARKKAR